MSQADAELLRLVRHGAELDEMMLLLRQSEETIRRRLELLAAKLAT